MRTVVNTYHATGMTYHMDDLLALARDNSEYDNSKKEMVEENLIDQRVYKYYFPDYPVELVPEPDNPYDPKAIKVVVGGRCVAYIKKGSTAHFHKQFREGRILAVQADIGGGPWKEVTEEENDDGKTVYELEKDESPYWVHLNVRELVEGEEPQEQPEQPKEISAKNGDTVLPQKSDVSKPPKKKNKFLAALQWVLGVLFVLVAALNQPKIGALPLMAMGLILPPLPFYRKIGLTGKRKAIVLVVLFFLIGAAIQA